MISIKKSTKTKLTKP